MFTDTGQTHGTTIRSKFEKRLILQPKLPPLEPLPFMSVVTCISDHQMLCWICVVESLCKPKTKLVVCGYQNNNDGLKIMCKVGYYLKFACKILDYVVHSALSLSLCLSLSLSLSLSHTHTLTLSPPPPSLPLSLP